MPVNRYLVFVLLTLCFLWGCQTSSDKQKLQDVLQTTQPDLLIRNGSLLDGTGSPAIKKDILLSGDSILFIGEIGELPEVATLNLDGEVVAPGFIDAHAHGDPLRHPEFINFLSMGVTTICLGQDGFSPPYKDIREWMGKVDESPAAQQGNELMYVTLLLTMLASLNGNRWVIEQPCSSCLFDIPIVSRVMQLTQAYRVKTYGGAFGQPTLKPLQLWSNYVHINALSREFPDYAIGNDGCVDRDGDKFTGRPDDLQMSEVYTPEFGRAVESNMMRGISRPSESEFGR